MVLGMQRSERWANLQVALDYKIAFGCEVEAD